jgi:hypothetical protein
LGRADTTGGTAGVADAGGKVGDCKDADGGGDVDGPDKVFLLGPMDRGVAGVAESGAFLNWIAFNGAIIFSTSVYDNPRLSFSLATTDVNCGIVRSNASDAFVGSHSLSCAMV